MTKGNIYFRKIFQNLFFFIFFYFFLFFLFVHIFSKKFLFLDLKKNFFCFNKFLTLFFFKKEKIFLFLQKITYFFFYFVLFGKYFWFISKIALHRSNMLLLLNNLEFFLNIFIYMYMSVINFKNMFFLKPKDLNFKKQKKSGFSNLEKNIYFIAVYKRWNLFWFLISIFFKNLTKLSLFFRVYFIFFQIFNKNNSIFDIFKIKILQNIK